MVLNELGTDRMGDRPGGGRRPWHQHLAPHLDVSDAFTRMQHPCVSLSTAAGLGTDGAMALMWQAALGIVLSILLLRFGVPVLVALAVGLWLAAPYLLIVGGCLCFSFAEIVHGARVNGWFYSGFVLVAIGWVWAYERSDSWWTAP